MRSPVRKGTRTGLVLIYDAGAHDDPGIKAVCRIMPGSFHVKSTPLTLDDDYSSITFYKHRGLLSTPLDSSPPLRFGTDMTYPQYLSSSSVFYPRSGILGTRQRLGFNYLKTHFPLVWKFIGPENSFEL